MLGACPLDAVAVLVPATALKLSIDALRRVLGRRQIVADGAKCGIAHHFFVLQILAYI
jgi:hypothetical protein